MKDNFLLKTTQINVFKELSDEDAGKLIKGIYEYATTKNIVLEGYLKVIFIPIKEEIDKNEESYKKRCEINKINGSKGGAPKGNTNAKQPRTTENNQKQPKTTENNMIYDNDYDYDSDINKKENTKRKKFTKPTVDEIAQYCKERNNGINANAFYDFYESKDWYVGKNKMKDWRASVRTWEKRNKEGIANSEPVWLNKEQQIELASIEEQEEIKKMLESYGR